MATNSVWNISQSNKTIQEDVIINKYTSSFKYPLPLRNAI